MSRSGYIDDGQNWDWIRWRGQVASSIRGKRGQTMLRELLAALEAMPTRRLIAEALERDGEVCALGALGRARGINMEGIDADDRERVAAVFDVAEPLAAEIAYLNDEYWDTATPEERWEKMHAWVSRKIREDAP